MLNTKQFGFVIWGVRNGFSKDLLSSDKVVEVNAAFNDSMRQICNDVINYFYSIEKTTNYTLLTIYNPNTLDHVHRKAYIAITLFAKNGTIFKGNIISQLDSLMNYTIQKQGNAIVNMFTEKMFEEQIQNISVQKVIAKNAHSNKQGYISYNSINEIEKYFENPSIDGYKKVYFYQKSIQLTLPLEFEHITVFKKNIEVGIVNYHPNKFVLFLNGKQLDIKNINQASIEAFEGDTLAVTEIITGNQKHILVSKQTIDLNNYFLSQPVSAYSYTSKKKNTKKIIILISIALIVIVGGVFIYSTMYNGTQNETFNNHSNQNAQLNKQIEKGSKKLTSNEIENDSINIKNRILSTENEKSDDKKINNIIPQTQKDASLSNKTEIKTPKNTNNSECKNLEQRIKNIDERLKKNKNNQELLDEKNKLKKEQKKLNCK